MLITSIAYGTRGDVQPALALAQRLQADGHTVRMVVASNFTDMVERHGLSAVSADVDTKALLQTVGGLDLIESGRKVSFPKSVKTMRKLFGVYGPVMIETAYRACIDADLILSAFLSNVLAVSIAEELGIRHVSTMLTPVALATRSGPATLGAPRPGTDSMANYLLQKAVIERVDWSLTRHPVDRFRRDVLRLPPQRLGGYLRRLRSTPVLHGISPNVVPHPGDWPATTHTTGYWFLPADPGWQPRRELLDFLDRGEPPVFLGFGSMTGRDPAATTRLLLDAVVRSGRRAIIQAGWAGLGGTGLPDGVHLIGTAPYGWLLSRVGAVVHHGGAGSTAESLRAGVPSVVIPHMGDQLFWGTRVRQLGVGPRPIHRAKLTAEGLAAAIREATGDPDMRRRAAELGAKIRAEDGVSAAARLINRYVSAS